MKRLTTLTGKNLPKLSVAKPGWPEHVTPSCGCVFCDIGLSPDAVKDSRRAHYVPKENTFVICTKGQTKKVADFTRVCAQTGLSERLRATWNTKKPRQPEG